MITEKVTFKTIFKGRLDFGTDKSYEKVVKMFQHRVESYYKQDILLDEEEIFDSETNSIKVPRQIIQGSQKSWKNTLSVLEYVAQFAVSGEVGAWMTEDGKILHHDMIEPTSDRVAVQAYLKGRKLVEQGKEGEAVAALDKAIDKFERHSFAYERRAFVKMQLKDYKSALVDYNKAVDTNEWNSAAYLGRATVRQLVNQDENIIEDLDMAIKTSIPLQPIFWQARRKKAEYYISRDEIVKALPDLKYFCSRRFEEDNPNYKWKRYMFYHFGLALQENGDKKEADAAFTNALELEDQGKINDMKLYQARGSHRKANKMKGSKDDLAKAAGLATALAN